MAVAGGRSLTCCMLGNWNLARANRSDHSADLSERLYLYLAIPATIYRSFVIHCVSVGSGLSHILWSNGK